MTSPASLTRTYQTYLQIRRQRTLAGAARVFRSSVAPYGFVTFACGELDLTDRNRSAYYVIDWPETWRKFYLGSNFIKRDPIIDSLAHRREPFTWSDLRRDRKFGKAGRDALRLLAAHGWLEGLVVPLAASGTRVGLVSLVGTQPDCDDQLKAHLSLISFGFHLHVRALAARQGFAVAPAGLTAREIACIRLAAHGKTDADIALTLGVARSTAHEFIEKAKHRLSARTRTELLGIAASLGIVDL